LHENSFPGSAETLFGGEIVVEMLNKRAERASAFIAGFIPGGQSDQRGLDQTGTSVCAIILFTSRESGGAAGLSRFSARWKHCLAEIDWRETAPGRETSIRLLFGCIESAAFAEDASRRSSLNEMPAFLVP